MNKMLLAYFNSTLKEDNALTVEMVSRELSLIAD